MYDELDLDMLGDERTALFLIMSDTDGTFAFLISLIYSILFNRLCERADDIYGGIDDINYSGKADSASYEAVMAMENIPDGFHRVTLVFKADGNVIDTKNIAGDNAINVSSASGI